MSNNQIQPYLGNPIRTEAVLRKFGFSFRKKYGQNFLIDPSVLEACVEGADVHPDDVVLEIGPGIGTLTQYLASAAKKVIAVEIDRALIPILEYTLAEWDNVEIVNDDILKIDLKELADRENGGRPIKVAANLPYYITTPILMQLFESGAPVETVSVMIQREVADRIEAEAGSDAYGALSLAMQYYAKAERIREVEPESFIPRPKVGSTVLRLVRYNKPPVDVQNEAQLFSLIRASFNQRRKMLANSVANFSGLSFSREQVQEALTSIGLSPQIRGEKLSLSEFAALSNALPGERPAEDASKKAAENASEDAKS